MQAGNRSYQVSPPGGTHAPRWSRISEQARSAVGGRCQTCLGHRHHPLGHPGRLHAHPGLHPSRRGAGGPRELPVAVRAAAGAAVSGLHQRHHHRADDRQGRHRRPRVAARRAGLALLRAGLHHRVRRARGGRVRARPMGAGAQGRAVDRRRASSSSASVCISSGCCACRCSTARRASRPASRARAWRAPSSWGSPSPSAGRPASAPCWQPC